MGPGVIIMSYCIFCDLRNKMEGHQTYSLKSENWGTPYAIITITNHALLPLLILWPFQRPSELRELLGPCFSAGWYGPRHNFPGAHFNVLLETEDLSEERP
jgi:hypothetical protein